MTNDRVFSYTKKPQGYNNELVMTLKCNTNPISSQFYWTNEFLKSVKNTESIELTILLVKDYFSPYEGTFSPCGGPLFSL